MTPAESTWVSREHQHAMAIGVLSKWMYDWCAENISDTGVRSIHELATALCDPTQHGPLANPEFVMKLPGHSPGCIHINATKATITYISKDQ